MLSLYRSMLTGFLASALGGFLVAGRPQELGELRHVPRQVLAFYYPWYGNPRVTGHWVHWSGVDESRKTIAGATHYPLLGVYDGHDARTVGARAEAWFNKYGTMPTPLQAALSGTGSVPVDVDPITAFGETVR